MTKHIKIKHDGAVLEIIFARPDKKNALSNAMYRAATEALDAAQKNQAIRVVLFAAEGDSFTAGNDLADFASAARERATGLPLMASSKRYGGPISRRRRRSRPRCRRWHNDASALRSGFHGRRRETVDAFRQSCACAGSSVQPIAAGAHWSCPCLRAIIVTGNTSALRGGPSFAGFAPTKAAQRILTESMARELGPKGVHVAYSVIDAVIDVPWARERYKDKPDEFFIKPAAIAEEVWHLTRQDRSAWSFNVELRPYGENW